MEEKEYGQSIMLNDNYEEESFPDIVEEVDYDAIEELKKNNPGRVKAIKTLDPITGIKASGLIADVAQTAQELLDETDREKRELSELAVSDLNVIFGNKIPDGYIESLELKLEKFSHIDYLKDHITEYNNVVELLGQELVDSVNKKIRISSISSHEALSRVAIKLFESFACKDAIYNDMEDFNKLSNKLSKSDESDDLNVMLKQMSSLLGAVSNLEESMARRELPVYSGDDVDVMLIDEIRETYTDAMSFKKIYKLLEDKSLCKKFKLDLTKKYKIAYNRIESWTADLANDSKVVYTFPTSAKSIYDKVANEKLTAEFIEYMANALIRAKLNNVLVNTEKANELGLIDFYLSVGAITKKEIEEFRFKAVLFAYVLSRVFKYKNVESSYDRRILSYTLDFVSKALDQRYRTDFYILVDSVYNSIMNS